MGEKNNNSDSILILVLGVLGFLFPIVGVLAIVFYKKFENEGRELDDMAKVGYVLGIITTVLMAISIFFGILAVLAFMGITFSAMLFYVCFGISNVKFIRTLLTGYTSV